MEEARERIHKDAIDAGMTSDSTPLRDGGDSATSYAEGIRVYLAMAVSKETVFLVTQARLAARRWQIGTRIW